MADPIETERLTLVPATLDMVEAEIAGAPGLAELIGAALPNDWPPEHHDAGVLAFTREKLADPEADGWWLHYFVWEGAPERTLAGTGGFVGPPRDGTVELGYSVVPSLQRRGIATEATAGLIARARERGAQAVVANTLPELAPSIGVLRKLGFEPAEPSRDGVITFRLASGA